MLGAMAFLVGKLIFKISKLNVLMTHLKANYCVV